MINIEEPKMFNKKFVPLLIIICLMIGVLTSCKSEAGTEETAPSFKTDTVFTVNGEEVSIGEWNLYA